MSRPHATLPPSLALRVSRCRPWDVDRDGFVMGEGAGVFVFESLEHAQKRGATILGEYLGGAVTCDAHHMTDPRADGLGVSTCIELAMKDAGIDREQINYINGHATRWGGSWQGDRGEGGQQETTENWPATCLLSAGKLATQPGVALHAQPYERNGSWPLHRVLCLCPLQKRLGRLP